MNDPWFRPKRVGFGASPASWKGWLATFVAVALAIVLVLYFSAQNNQMGSIIGVAIVVVAFLLLVRAKGGSKNG